MEVLMIFSKLGAKNPYSPALILEDAPAASRKCAAKISIQMLDR